jgi:uncharacterized membrane protein
LKIKKRGNSHERIIIIFFIIFFIWIFLQFLSPFILPTGIASNLSGQTGISDNKQIISKMPFPIGSVYGCGDRLCHQLQERSIILNENQMPFCSRCTAIWLGIAIGLGLIILYKIELDEKFIFIMLIGIIPIAIDGIGQILGFWTSNNIIRLITGSLIGVICGLSIGIIIEEIMLFKKKVC